MSTYNWLFLILELSDLKPNLNLRSMFLKWLFCDFSISDMRYTIWL